MKMTGVLVVSFRGKKGVSVQRELLRCVLGTDTMMQRTANQNAAGLRRIYRGGRGIWRKGGMENIEYITKNCRRA